MPSLHFMSDFIRWHAAAGMSADELSRELHGPWYAAKLQMSKTEQKL